MLKSFRNADTDTKHIILSVHGDRALIISGYNGHGRLSTHQDQTHM